MGNKAVKTDFQVEVLSGMKLKQYPWGYIAEKSSVIVGSQNLADVLDMLNRALHDRKL